MTDPTTDPATIALAADMIFSAKIQGAARTAGTTVRMARNAAQLLELAGAGAPRLILLDLDARGLPIGATIEALRGAAPDAHILAYVSHVRTDAIAEARAAGADRVLARSGFDASLVDILRAGR